MTTKRFLSTVKRTCNVTLRLMMVLFFVFSAVATQPALPASAAPRQDDVVTPEPTAEIPAQDVPVEAAPPAEGLDGAVAPLAPALAWSAYNDCSGTTGGNTTAYTIPSGAGLLRNYATGGNTAITATFTASSGTSVQTAGAMPNSGTDAYNTFNGFVNMAGVLNYSSTTGWYINVTFTGLDPAKTYTFVTTANRDNSAYSDRVSKFTIQDLTSATNESTSGTTISTTTVANDTTAFLTGYNTVNGYVARWTGINPGADGDFNVRVVSNSTTVNEAYGPSGFMLGEETTGPTITTSGTLSPFSSQPGVPSTAQSYTVSGTNLISNIVITAPTDFQVSTDNINFDSSLTLTQTGGTVGSTTIYARLNRATEGTPSGNISHTSTDATTRNVAVSGTVSLCNTVSFQQGINSYTGAKDTWLSLANPTYNYGGATTVLVDGIEPNTTGDDAVILLYWDISSIPTGSTVTSASIDVYITNESSLSFPMYDMLQSWTEGTNNGAAGTGASWNFYGAGTGSWPGGSPINASSRNNTELATFTGPTINSARNISLNSSGLSVLEGWISTPANNRGFQVAHPTNDNSLQFTSKEGTTVGNRPKLNVTYCAITGPTITVTGSLAPFSSQPGVPSTAQSYSVSGSNLTANIVITAPTDFQVSTDNINFDSSLTLTQIGGTVGSTTIYARMNRATEGTPSGTISHTSTDATTRNVAVSGTVVNYYTLTTTVSPLASGSITLNPAGGYYPSGTVVTVTAIPAANYAFGTWSGDLAGSTNPTTITMDANHSITANFLPLVCTDVSLTAVADNWLRGSQTTTNYGGDLILSMNPNGTNSQISLLRWDLSSIPANATINSGSLTVYVTDDGANAGPSTKLFYLYSLRRAWVEGTGTTDNTPSTTSSNWNTYDGVNTWGSGGAQNTTSDRYNTNLWTATTSTFNVTTNTSVTVPLNSSGVSVLQGWYATPASNFGLTVQNPATDSDYLVFASSEASVVAQRPQLNLNYCVPVTGPTINVSGSLSSFLTPLGTSSAAQTYTVSGSNLTADILITPPAGFELSTNSSSYSSTLTLAQSGGTVNSTTVYVRLTGAAVGSFSGNIAHTSTDATTRNLAASGTVAVYYTLTTSITPSGAGSVTLNPTGGYYPSGTVVTLTAVANSGFAFDSWAGDASGTTNPTTVTMNGNRIVEAIFETAEVCTTVNLEAVDDNYISNYSTSTNNNYGASTTLKATRDADNNRAAFFRWNLSAIPSNATVDTVSLSLYISTAASQTYNLYNVRRNWLEGTGASAVTNDGATWLTYNGVNTWTTSGASSITEDRYDTNLWSAGTTSFSTTGVKTEALNTSGVAVVQGWINGSGANYGVTMQNYSTSTTLNDDLQFASAENTTNAGPTLNIHYCIPAPQYTLSITPDANGTVSVDPVAATYSHGSVVTLAPVPNSGYVFGSWGGANAEDPTDNGNGTWSLVMDENKILTAAFSLIPVNVAPNAPVLLTPADDATGVSTPPTLTVTASDPNAGDTSLTVNFYGRPTGGTAGPDFTVIAIPDTQNEAQYYPTVMYNQLDWIELGTADNIVFATSMGDIVNTYSSATQYASADAAYDRLDLANVPYSVSPGNHDTGSGSLYETYFGVLRFSGKTWYQGHYGSDNYNNYSFFSASGNDFILINLQYSPTTAHTDWADALLKANPGRRGIVVQHNVLNTDNSWNSQTSFLALRDNPNFFLMLCGHMHTSSDGSAYRAETGTNGQTIHVLMTDYQDFPNGGNGYLRLLRFSPADDKIYSTVYSPTIPGYRTSSTDYEQFEMVYDLNGSTAAAYTLIGTTTTTNGGNASVVWSGLADTTEYEWYATVSDAALTTTGSTWSFTTGSGNAAPVITEGASIGVTMSEDGNPTAFSVSLHATDANVGDTLTWSLASPASHGTASASGTGASPTVTYAPTTDYNGADAFTVQVSDGQGGTDSIIVSVTIQAVNDAPVISAQAALSTPEDTALAILLTNLTVTDVDDSYPADFTLTVLSGSNYTLAGSTITPALNYNGTLTVPVYVNDGSANSNTFNLTVTVAPANDAPFAADDSSVAIVDTPLDISTASLLANDSDVDGPSLSISAVGSPLNGTVVLNGSIITFTPAAGFTGTAGFDYTLSDGTLTDTGHVTVIVSAAPLIYTILLRPGWNLVSFNLVPVNPATTAVLASVAGQYNLVYAWDASLTSNNWLHYDPAQSVGNDLLTLTSHQGFWINITAATPITLTITGTPPVTSIIQLFDDSPGAWNLVSFPSSTSQPLPEALSLHGANDLGLLIFSYRAGDADVWKMYDRTAPAYANDLSSLTPGWGYWIKVTADWDWEVAY